MPPKFEIIARDTIYQDQYRTFKKLMIARDGIPGVYTYVEGHDFVAIMPISPTLRTPIIRQYRFPIDRDKWEICCGVIDQGETPMIAAARELQEEMGVFVDVKDLIRLGQAYVSSGMSDAQAHFFMTSVSDAQLDTLKTPDHMDEILELKIVSLDELDDMASSGQMVCGPALMTLYHVHRHLRQVKNG